MSKIEPFAEWINENEDQSLEDLKRMRELGTLGEDGHDLYRLCYEKFDEDPAVVAAKDTLRKKFDEYTEALFPYNEYSDTWEEVQNEIGEERVGDVGWFEYLMVS